MECHVRHAESNAKDRQLFPADTWAYDEKNTFLGISTQSSGRIYCISN